MTADHLTPRVVQYSSNGWRRLYHAAFLVGVSPTKQESFGRPSLVDARKTACYCPYGNQSMLDSALSSISPGISALNSSWMLGAGQKHHSEPGNDLM